MASQKEGFGYDIFISYRQKDNKGEKWVSEFVEALRSELDATIKDEVSIYFDENPHDGLLETHDVDASLKEKLKCLIFIPVISKTYCDQRSFAWIHEFMSFVETASSDSIGLRVKLPNGNVACRVLPVRIHDIDQEDIKLCESILGGNIRGIDFVYRSAGVNRPLRINEDYPQNNQNKTYYRDQLNKVANAIDEIFHALKSREQQYAAANDEAAAGEAGARRRIKRRLLPELSGPKRKTLLILSFILCAAAAVVFYSLFDSPEPKNTVAVLPFRSQPGNPEMTAQGDLLAELTRTRLEKIPGVTVRSGISTNSYRGTDKALKTIRRELDINYLIDGTFRSAGGTTLMWINIVDARNDRQLWSEEYTWDSSLVSGIASGVAREFALSCNIRLTAEQLRQIEKTPTTRTDAYLNFVSANVTYNDAWGFFSTGARLLDSSALLSAVNEYTAAIGYDSLFAEAYARRAIAYAWGYHTARFDSTYIERCNSDISRAFELAPALEDAMIARGFYYYYCLKDFRNALIHFNRIAVMDPSNYQPLFYMALIYRKMGEWDKSQSLIKRVMTQNPQVPVFLTNIGLSYQYLHKYDSAIIYHQQAIEANPGWSSPYVNKIESLLALGGKSRQARHTIAEA
ncbi:MAG: hypothetical protein MUD02_11075, partial [Bacteroidales bacterium]|nr:hypothetical protein [Bacteroidales bacterium]